MVSWFTVIFGEKHVYWMNVRKMLRGVRMIDRTELCKILNSYYMEIYILAHPGERLPEEHA